MTTPTGVTVSNIKNGGTSVSKTNNWSSAGGKLTLKSSYLATLDNGDNVFTATFSNGDVSTLTVTISV